MYRQRTSYPGVARLLLASTLLAFGCGFAVGIWTSSPLDDAAQARALAEVLPPPPSGDDRALALPEIAAGPASARGESPPPGLTAGPSPMGSEPPPPQIAAAPPSTRSELPPRLVPAARLPRQTPAAPNPVPELHAAPPPADDPVVAVEPEREEASPVTTEQVTVRRGDTLMDILKRVGVNTAEAHAAVASLQEVYDPRRLRAGQEIAVELQAAPNTDDGGGEQVQLAGLTLGLSFEQDVRVSRGDDDGGFAATTVDRPLRRDVALSLGSIDDSLYLAATRAGVPEATLIELVRLFSWDVDFQRDIQPEDTFETLFERVATADGSEVRGGDLLFANLTLSGRSVSAYRFERADGGIDYFDEQGRSLRKSLLRTPVDGARLSSRYGPRRHPILGYTRMHRGIDFAAPTGTPIYAAGDGEIAMIGRNAGYGNYIRIRHNGEYATAYAHLKGFAKGLRRGSRVEQGQVIGYLGSTGMSTGPHLHYEVMRNGEQVNPLSIKQTVAAALTGAELKRFRAHVAEIDAKRRDLTHGTRLASRAE